MSGTDLPKISDEDAVELLARRAWRRRHSITWESGADIERQEFLTAARLDLAALVASGYRREVDVLREAADRIDPGPASTRRPALNDLDDMQMTCDRGVATRLRTWANIRDRDRATALEQAQGRPGPGEATTCPTCDRAIGVGRHGRLASHYKPGTLARCEGEDRG